MERQLIIEEELNIKVDGLIVPIVINNNTKVIEIKNRVYELGYAIGAIRQPTVTKAILRVIARLGESKDELRLLCKNLDKIKQ